MPLEDSYLGQGWSFPPSFVPPADGQPGGVVLVAGLTDIEQSLHILLTTRLGERVLAPDYGADLHPLLFEALHAGLTAQLQHLVQAAVLYHEPRINFLDLTAEQSAEEPGLLLLDLAYQVRSTNSRHNYVYPFYLQEGSELALAADPPGLAPGPDLG